MNRRFLNKLVILSLCCLSLFTFGSCSKNNSKNLNIAIYGIQNQNVAKGIELTLSELCESNGFTANYVYYNLESPLKEQIGNEKLDLIIASGGFATNSAAQISQSEISENLLSNMTSSIKLAALKKDNKIMALPLVNDFMELEVNVLELNSKDDVQINSWDKFTNIAKSLNKKIEHPINFAGKNSREALDFYGALCEALDGIDSYNDAVKIMTENKDLSTAQIASLLCDSSDSPLASTISYLKNWNKQNLINRSSFTEFTAVDLDSYAKYGENAIVFTELSTHRDLKNFNRFTQFYFPSKINAGERHFTANVISAVQTSKNTNVSVLLEALASAQVQGNLARNTGLAPVVTNARTPDIQSDDARFYVAATSSPVAGLGFESGLSSEKLAAICAEIKGRIIY